MAGAGGQKGVIKETEEDWVQGHRRSRGSVPENSRERKFAERSVRSPKCGRVIKQGLRIGLGVEQQRSHWGPRVVN